MSEPKSNEQTKYESLRRVAQFLDENFEWLVRGQTCAMAGGDADGIRPAGQCLQADALGDEPRGAGRDDGGAEAGFHPASRLFTPPYSPAMAGRC